MKPRNLLPLLYAILASLMGLVGLVIGWRWWLSQQKNGEILPEPAIVPVPLREIEPAISEPTRWQKIQLAVARYQPALAILRLLALPMIGVLAYQAHVRFADSELLEQADRGFWWLAAGGLLLLVITPTLHVAESRPPVNLNLAGKRRLLMGGFVWLVGAGLLVYAARQYWDLKEFEMPTPAMYNRFGVGLLLWLGGGLLVTRSATPPVPKITVWLPVVVFVLGIFLRLYDLSEQPRGIWYDEAINTLEARHILQEEDYRPIFVPNITAAHLFLYAAGLEIFGETSIIGPRLLSVFFGAASVILAFLVGRLLRDAHFGVLFALLMAVMRWSLNFSRIAMTGIEMSFFILLGLYFLIRLMRYGQMRDALLLGLTLGGGLWFYSAFRILGLTLIVYGLLAWRRWPSWNAVILAGVIVFSTLATIFPLAIFARTNPDMFLNRTRGVTILNDEARDPGRSFEDAFVANLEKHARMFHIWGDANGRHNDPGEPMLDPYTGLLFGLGLVLSLRYLHRPETVFFILLLAAGLSGGVLTFEFEAPQGLRSIGVLPAVGYFAALAAWTIGYTVWRGINQIMDALSTPFFRGMLDKTASTDQMTGVLFAPASQGTGVVYGPPSISAKGWVTDLPVQNPHLIGSHLRTIVSVLPQTLLFAGGLLLAILVTESNFTAYFDKQRKDFFSFYEFSITETLVGEYAAAQPEDTRFYVSPLIAYQPVGEFVDAQPEKWTLLPLPIAFPIRTAPEHPVVVFLHHTDTRQYEYARQFYPNAVFDEVTASDYGVEQRDNFPVLFYIVALQPEDIASVQGLVATDDTAEGYLYTPTFGTYQFWFEEGTTLTIDGETLAESGDEIALASGMMPVEIHPAGAKIRWISPDDDRIREIPDWQFYHEPVNDFGLLAASYPNPDWEGRPVRLEIMPDINWQIHVSPMTRPYSMRWTGQLIIEEAGDYLLELQAAQYGEVYLNGELVVKTRVPRESAMMPYTFDVGAYAIEVKFQDTEGYSSIFLRWRTPSGTDFVPIPRQNFRPE